jgi:iron complex outermembrane recepter protein
MLSVDARGGDDVPAPESLKELSLEQLADLEVTSASRHPEKLADTAAAIEVITADDIRRSGATSLPEALRLANSLDVAQKNAHDWAITTRGFNINLGNKLLVMIDGRTIYTPLFSGVFWDAQHVLLEDIDRIEVISGPGGTLWGANAVNGIINIITKAADDTRGLYAEAGGGTQLRDSGAIRYGAELASGVAGRVYALAFNHDSEEHSDGTSAHDEGRRSQAGFRVDGTASPSDRFTLQGDGYDADEGTLGGTVHLDGANVLGRWSHAASDRADWTLQAYFDHTHLDDPIAAQVLNGVELAPAGVLSDDLDTFDLDFQNRLRVGARNELTWGFGYRHTRDEVANAPALALLPATLEQDLYSVFIQDELTLHPGLTAVVGTKIEHNDYTGIETEPSVRLAWNFAASQSLWAAVSRAVRTPSRIDRDAILPAPEYGPAFIEGSSDFTSESVVAYELGYRAQLGAALAVSASLFHNDYDDLRSTGTTPATLLPFVLENNLEGHTDGAELGADWRVSERWRLRAGYAFLKEHIRVKPGAIDLNDARSETADPESRWSLRSSFDIASDTALDIGLRSVGKRSFSADPAIAVSGYTEMDAALRWRATPHVELSVAGQNLLHASHLEYGPRDGNAVELGRSVFGKIAWTY